MLGDDHLTYGGAFFTPIPMNIKSHTPEPVTIFCRGDLSIRNWVAEHSTVNATAAYLQRTNPKELSWRERDAIQRRVNGEDTASSDLTILRILNNTYGHLVS